MFGVTKLVNFVYQWNSANNEPFETIWRTKDAQQGQRSKVPEIEVSREWVLIEEKASQCRTNASSAALNVINVTY